MKKIIILLLLFMIVPDALAQSTITPEMQFRKDVANNTIHIYILGGLMDRVQEGEADFQEEYNITYYKFGCLAPPNLSFYSDYNLLAFVHLKNKFGAAWEGKIRKDVIAWNKWKPEE